MTIHWMIFKPEGNDVLYLWDGTWAIIFHVAEHEGEISDWYWNDNPPKDISDTEIKLLNTVAETKRKQIFTVPRIGKRRYQVLQRGSYEYTNT